MAVAIISLRGPVRRKEGGKWEWTGVWAFGNLPECDHDSSPGGSGGAPVNGASNGSHKGSKSRSPRSGRKSSKSKAQGPLSFRYTFNEPVDASTVIIPWYTRDEEENESEQDAPTTTELRKSSGPQDESKSVAVADSKPVSDRIVNSGNADTVTGRGDADTGSQSEGKSEVNSRPQHESSISHPMIEDDENGKDLKNVVSSTESSPSSSPLRRPEVEESCPPLRDKQNGVETSSSKAPPNTPTITVDGNGEESSVVTNSSNQDESDTADAASNRAESSQDESGISENRLSLTQDAKTAEPLNTLSEPEESVVQVTRGLEHPSQTPEACLSNGINGTTPVGSSEDAVPPDSTTKVSVAVDADQQKSSPQDVSSIFREKNDVGKKDSSDKKKVTFATLSVFKDAGKQYPDKCPAGGTWKGHFENVQQRKDRKSNRVSETFYLYFNALSTEKDPSSKTLNGTTNGCSSNHIFHVRGMGSNQFGTFELEGSFNLVSGVLHCRRIYVLVPQESSTAQSKQARRQSKPRDSRKSRAESTSTSTITERPYFTRKRQMSWQRHDASSDDEHGDELNRQLKGNKKRKDFDNGRSKQDPAKAVDDVPAKQACSKRRSPPSSSGSKNLSSAPRVNGSSTKTAGGSGVGAKRSKSEGDTRSSNVILLPSVPDPSLAKWRSAFIFNRTKIEEEPVVNSGATPSNPSIRYNQCIYEGELVSKNGKVLREGHGTCLYENGNIYQGTWRRNKEHGRGTLMTGDRKFVIYEGDWERGRMHGRGVYYYSVDQNYEGPSKSKQDLGDAELNPERQDRGGGIYRGDFKENCRHGFGVYTLPDGCIYDGEWRDNVQCGRGAFRWTDGSTYDGQWKKGKRNGNGLLIASDGFKYEGQWVANAMEGRGVCLYPNGQRYEGLWVKGKKEGRGTIIFSNGAVYEGRFRDDRIEGQGTMKISSNVALDAELLPPEKDTAVSKPDDVADKAVGDWMIPIQFQSDMGHIHQRAGFTTGGS